MKVLAQSSILGALITSAIALSILLRTRRSKLHTLFAYFNINLAIWYMSKFSICSKSITPIQTSWST